MKKLLIKWEQKTHAEINKIAHIIDENFAAYGLAYKSTVEYAFLNRDYEILKFKRSLIQSILKLWN